jgi:nardilysin
MLQRFKRNGAATMKEGKSKIQKIMNTSLLTTPIKSISDRKEYRLIKLENGLKALLIHHDFDENIHAESNLNMSSSESEQEEEGSGSEYEDDGHEREKLAAVGLSIGTGSFNDPKDIQGLAHFVGKTIYRCSVTL